MAPIWWSWPKGRIWDQPRIESAAHHVGICAGKIVPKVHCSKNDSGKPCYTNFCVQTLTQSIYKCFHIIILFLPSFYVHWFIPCLSVVNMSICVGEKCVHQIFIFALSSINCPPSVELLMLVESLNSNQCLLPTVLLAWQPAEEWNIYIQWYNDAVRHSWDSRVLGHTGR